MIIDHNAGTVVGDPVTKRDVELRSGDELTIPVGTSLTIADSAVFRNNGTVILKGSFMFFHPSRPRRKALSAWNFSIKWIL